MNAETIFFIVWLLVGTYVLTTLYRKGKKALAIFPDISSVRVVYRDKWASGYSTKSWITKSGGSNKVLDIVVTDKELWLRGLVLFVGAAQRYDLVHRIPLERIAAVDRQGKRITVRFRSELGEEKQVVLITKRPDDLVRALHVAANTRSE